MENAIFVLITEPLSPEIISRLQEISPQLEFHVHPANHLEEVPSPLLARAEVLYTLRIVPAPDQPRWSRWRSMQ
jgi:hypothetical protein